MTLAEQIKANRVKPLDEEFKNSVRNILLNYDRQHGIKDTELFKFRYYKGEFGYEVKSWSINVYDGKNHDVYVRLIDVPSSYETKQKEIEEWMISEGFKRAKNTNCYGEIIGEEYFKENVYFKLA